MPSTGFYLFLRTCRIARYHQYSWVSMPSTGFYLFLRICTRKLCRNDNVSMPSTGFYLFLPSRFLLEMESCLCVSMPSTGFYLFLRTVENCYQYSKGVNALNGLLLISSYENLDARPENKCVNALNGLLLISSILQKTI